MGGRVGNTSRRLSTVFGRILRVYSLRLRLVFASDPNASLLPTRHLGPKRGAKDSQHHLSSIIQRRHREEHYLSQPRRYPCSIGEESLSGGSRPRGSGSSRYLRSR